METIPQSEFKSKHESSKSHCCALHDRSKTSCLQLRLTRQKAFTLLPLAVQFLLLCRVKLGFSWHTDVWVCPLNCTWGFLVALISYTEAFLSPRQWQRDDLLFSAGKPFCGAHNQNFSKGLKYFGKVPVTLYEKESINIVIVKRNTCEPSVNSAWRALKCCSSECNSWSPCTSWHIHITLGRIHAVVQGLDGHPAHRQPPLKAMKKIQVAYYCTLSSCLPSVGWK